MGDESIVDVPVRRVSGSAVHLERDLLAVEEPLEIRLSFHFKGRAQSKSISVTMRTPGNDRELAAGFLVGEGIVNYPGQITAIRHLGDGSHNELIVELDPSVDVDITRLDRHFYTTSSCGVCGKSSLEAIAIKGTTAIPIEGFSLPATTLHGLPQLARSAQPVFSQTGGLHAAALFDEAGALVDVREDVGRHNALDKMIGHQFLSGNLPLHNRLLLVSGRVSFELMQKAVTAGIPVVAAIGAPSSLAVELAQQFHITLAGFLRDNQCNIYTGHWRITT